MSGQENASEEPTLFDVAGGRAGRDEGMARADEHADQDWKVRAYELIEFFARARGEYGFTSDDVMARLKLDGYTTHEPRALGAVFTRAARAGVIVKAGYEESKRPERHRGVVTRWRRP